MANGNDNIIYLCVEVFRDQKKLWLLSYPGFVSTKGVQIALLDATLQKKIFIYSDNAYYITGMTMGKFFF